MLPSGLPYDDSITQAPFYREPEPQYQCSAADCDYAAFEPGELTACIECGSGPRYCADHLISIGGEKYCTRHAKCSCGEPAIDSCMECGAVLCEKCLGDFEECKPCRRAGPDPDDLPAEAYDADDFRDQVYV